MFFNYDVEKRKKTDIQVELVVKVLHVKMEDDLKRVDMIDFKVLSKVHEIV